MIFILTILIMDVPGIPLRGILCATRSCASAVWLAMGDSVTDKTIGMLFPIRAFVTIGFEHPIANWFFLPYGLRWTGKTWCRLSESSETLQL